MPRDFSRRRQASRNRVERTPSAFQLAPNLSGHFFLAKPGLRFTPISHRMLEAFTIPGQAARRRFVLRVRTV
jgi:hypothetical protein